MDSKLSRLPLSRRHPDFRLSARGGTDLSDRGCGLGRGNTATTTWRTEHLHQLKHDGPTDLVPNLRTFAADHLTDPQVLENLAYLEKRVGQIQYPSFQAQGWPISSGPVESGNKLVVE